MLKALLRVHGIVDRSLYLNVLEKGSFRKSLFRAVQLMCWSWPHCPVLCDIFKLLNVFVCAKNVTKTAVSET